MTTPPIILAWEAARCEACGKLVRRLGVQRGTGAPRLLERLPVPVVVEDADGRRREEIGYPLHRCNLTPSGDRVDKSNGGSSTRAAGEEQAA